MTSRLSHWQADPPPPREEGLGAGRAPIAHKPEQSEGDAPCRAKKYKFPPVLTPPPAPPRKGEGGTWRNVGELFRTIASTARLMVGVPDYEAYVAHRANVHPGEPVMSYEEFFRERQASRYATAGGKISRCC